jgi:hypothetical protein
MRLPSRWQEYSNACDMRRILEASCSIQMVKMVTEGEKRHLDGAELDPEMLGGDTAAAAQLSKIVDDHTRGRRQ